MSKYNKKDLEALKDYIMPKTKEVFEKILKIKRLNSKLKFESKYCDEFKIPQNYLESGEGVDADLVIFVSIDDTGFFLQNEIEAAAIHCLQHSITNRPVAGYIQFKPDLNMIDTTALDYLAWLAIHEVSHILVMNDGLYQSYIDSDNKPLGANNVLYERKHPISGKDMTVIKSPKVLEVAKSHFNCQSLDGVPLEYNGGPGTSGAHWSKKVMNTDYMIGDSYGENLISVITLALFEDSGWYKVDYNISNLFLWGKDKGCQFFSHKCVSESPLNIINREGATNGKRVNKVNEKSNIVISIQEENHTENEINDEEELISSKKNNRTLNNHRISDERSSIKRHYSEFPDEFCEVANRDICSRHNIFRGVCSMKKFSSALPEYERYFSNKFYGGVDNLTDRCPISMENKGSQYYYGGSCRKGEKRNDLDDIGPESACFMSSLKKNDSHSKRNAKRLRFKQLNSGNQRQIDNNRKTVSGLSSSSKENNEIYEEDLTAGCFKFNCDRSGKIEVSINNINYKCESNSSIEIRGYSGKIICPDAKVLCHDKFKCKFGCTERYSVENGYKRFQ